MNELKPFLRYVRILLSNKQEEKPSVMAYDARFFYILKGSICFDLEGQRKELNKGDAIIIAPAVKYSYCNNTGDKTQIFAINFDYTMKYKDLEAPIPPDKPEDFDFSNTLSSDFMLFLNWDICRILQYEDTLYKIILEYNSKLLGYQDVCSGLFLSLLINCKRNLKGTVKRNGDNLDCINNIIDYIHNNFDKDLSNKFIGNMFYFHPIYVNNLMKKNTGLSLHNYLLRLRIDSAIRLLETSSLSIADIAIKSGFKDISYFSRYFKKVTGKRPSKFR